MSDILSPINNPEGYLFAIIAMIISGLMLLPSATFFQSDWYYPYKRWAVLGAWLYRIGLIAVITVGISTPFQMPYASIHIWLTYIAFMGIVGGLAICLGVALRSAAFYRFTLAIILILLISVFLFLIYVSTIPDYFNGRRWFLAFCEWLLSVIIAVSVLTMASVKAQVVK